MSTGTGINPWQVHRAEATELVRVLIEKIVLVPTEEKDELKIDLYGDLAGMLSTAEGACPQAQSACGAATRTRGVLAAVRARF